MTDFDNIDWLESHADNDDLARSLNETGALDETDPKIAALLARATIGSGTYSRRLQAMIFRPVKTNASHRAALRVFERVRQHNPATRPSPWARSRYDEPLDELPEAWEPPPALATRINQDLPPAQVRKWDELLSFEQLWDITYVTPAGDRKQINPFRAPARPGRASRSSLLTGEEVMKLYDGLSFAMWRHGVTMNVHVVIIWSMMGIDEVEGAKRLGKYLSEAMKWMQVGSGPRWHRVKNPREGVELRYAWVHENAPGRGFHSHILMNVPPALTKSFEVWSRSCLARHHGSNFPFRTFRLVKSYAKTQDAAVRRHWSWFRYLTKELEPATELVTRHRVFGVSTKAMRDVIKPWPLRSGVPVPRMKMTGVSHSIGQTAQAKDRFKSMLAKGKFNQLYGGDEFLDRDRLKLTASLVVDDYSDYWA